MTGMVCGAYLPPYNSADDHLAVESHPYCAVPHQADVPCRTYPRSPQEFSSGAGKGRFPSPRDAPAHPSHASEIVGTT